MPTDLLTCSTSKSVRGTWRPLLEGKQRIDAVKAVAAIADQLRELIGSADGLAERPSGGGTALNPSLAAGTAGFAVLFAYLSQDQSAPSDDALAAELLDRAVTAASDGTAQASLYGGLAGVGWAAAHLEDRLPDLDTEDVTAEIDEALREHLSPSQWSADYDLINGLVGFGVYALERWPEPAAVASLERVIEHLARTAEHRPEGITWWTNPDWLIPETREKFPKGYYNLGLAHGVPGVIALLGCACAADVAVEKARPLLEGAVRWLLSQQHPAGFPAWVAADGCPAPARLAWCYGDLGVAVSLLWAARCVNEPAWEIEALAIARRAAERPHDKSGVVDAGLCHGAAGAGHLFNRLYQATGEEGFATAARFWFERTLTMRQPGRGIAGYAAWMPGIEGNKDGWIDDPGVLTGAAGIGLALLAATTTIEPDWDRMLLVSVPPRPAG
jgi:lantibiotic modifying enzyme